MKIWKLFYIQGLFCLKLSSLSRYNSYQKGPKCFPFLEKKNQNLRRRFSTAAILQNLSYFLCLNECLFGVDGVLWIFVFDVFRSQKDFRVIFSNPFLSFSNIDMDPFSVDGGRLDLFWTVLQVSFCLSCWLISTFASLCCYWKSG